LSFVAATLAIGPTGVAIGPVGLPGAAVG
jgi:hypothetical protein